MIHHLKGDIFHGMKKSDPGFRGFGEAYFSTVKCGEVKAWKRHKRMTLNLIVPVGEVRFVIYDDRPQSGTCGNFLEVTLSPDNYLRLTIPPDLWVGFMGGGGELNLLLNIAEMEHDPNEVDRLDLNNIEYDWDTV